MSYINNEGDLRSSSLCALLSRILTWDARKPATLKARHIPDRLNVVADKLQARQDHQNRVVSPSRVLPVNLQQLAVATNLFDMRFNNKLPLSVSPVPDPLAVAVDELRLPYEDLDAYAFPQAAIMGKVLKLQDCPCKRIILIASGWPTMPWFWDLVAISSKITSLPNLPNLLIQPFNQTPHRNPPNLNLHAWLLEPQL